MSLSRRTLRVSVLDTLILDEQHANENKKASANPIMMKIYGAGGEGGGMPGGMGGMPGGGPGGFPGAGGPGGASGGNDDGPTVEEVD